MDVTIDKNESFGVLDVPQSNVSNGASIEFVKQAAPPPVPRRSAPPVAPPPVPRPQLQTQPSMLRGDLNKTLEEFANPRKLRPMDDLDDGTPMAGYTTAATHDGEGDSDITSGEDASDGQADEQYSVDEPAYDTYAQDDVLHPSPGFTTLDEEKAHLIFKIHRAKRAGMPVTRTFSMQSDLKEMRAEMSRIDHELSLDASIKFQRKMLMMTVSTMEFLNKRYDPFQLHLDDWSQSVVDSIHDYDRVFERLHEKYKTKVAVAPEIELLMMLAGSAMMYHFTNSMFKRSLPGLSGGGGNPELMTSMMKAMMQATGGGGGGGGSGGAPQPPQPEVPRQQQQQQQQQAPARREMRGPPMDIGGLVGSMGGGAMPFPPMPPPMPSGPPKKAVSFAAGTKRPAEMDFAADFSGHAQKKTKDAAADENDSMSSIDGDDDRLSDVISEDLESVAGTEADDASTTFTFSTVGGRGGRGRGGRGRGRASGVKNVITL